MGETDYNAQLYDKMKAEQDKYRDWLLSQPPEEILNHTYEYTMREDIEVYGGTGAFSETGKGFASFSLPS